jgi:hypothetical protein
MCDFPNCTTKNYKDTPYCYRHRGQLKKAQPVTEDKPVDIISETESSDIESVTEDKPVDIISETESSDIESVAETVIVASTEITKNDIENLDINISSTEMPPQHTNIDDLQETQPISIETKSKPNKVTYRHFDFVENMVNSVHPLNEGQYHKTLDEWIAEKHSIGMSVVDGYDEDKLSSENIIVSNRYHTCSEVAYNAAKAKGDRVSSNCHYCIIYDNAVERQRYHDVCKTDLPSELDIVHYAKIYDEAMFELCALLPGNWMNDSKNLWQLARTIYEMPAEPITMRCTYALILNEHQGGYFKQHIALAQYDHDGPSASAKFPTSPLSLSKIKAIAGGNDSAAYDEWKRRYEPQPDKDSKKSAADQLKELISEAEQMEDLIADAISNAIGTIDSKLIYENNGIEANDLLMTSDSKVFSIYELALLIRQTIVRTENNGEPMLFVKIMAEYKYKRSRVDAIKFEPRKPSQMKQYCFEVDHENAAHTINLAKILDRARSHINYKKVVVEPYGAYDCDEACKRRNFNLFSGFVQRFDKDFKYDINIAKLWTEHLRVVVANGDETVYQYLLMYFKHILVNPMEKTGTVIVIKGKQGSGKNSPFDIFYRFVLGPSLSLTTPNMELITGRFNSISQSLIGCVLDEAVDNADRSVMNKFKNLITADERQIELKGKEPYNVGDFANYVVISNNDFASLIEESDRRALCLETSNDMIGNRKYFNNFFKVLGNMDAGKHIFHYLLNEVELPEDWHPQDTPNTAYKKELKQAQASATIKFLINTYEKLVEANAADGGNLPNDEISQESTKWWDDHKRFCESNNHRLVSSAAFYKMLKPHVSNKKSNGKNFKIVTIASLKESLKAYL